MVHMSDELSILKTPTSRAAPYAHGHNLIGLDNS